MSRIKNLQDRAHMLSQARQFFAERGVLEVDCPIMSRGAAIDVNIDLVSAIYSQTETCYLHSSPEYGMKRLLSEGIGDIYQLSHVFRDGEQSAKHNPEFMMAEWYRLGITFEQMMEETVDFCRLFLGSLPSSTISYRDALRKYTSIDHVTASDQELRDYLAERGTLDADADRDVLLNYVLGIDVEPHLSENELTVLAYYPATQAALARTIGHGKEAVAERFEIYYKGVELANGYHELTDGKEQRRRFEHDNAERVAKGKSSLPIDEPFLKALEKGLPDCCGVAVGFDRLMMLRLGAKSLREVIPFVWH
ncbi:MAG: EF-P lysine aminoacylase EpmA [Chlamydiales bacterium]|nr:EF-P lysine aminoacylase EpmA [Chlamydiales bacterium]